MSRFRRLNQQIDTVGDLRQLSVLRILLGPVVLLHLRDTFTAARDGIVYSDRFYLPYFDWYPEVGPTLYEVLLWACAISAIAMSVGLATRLATSYTALFVGYNIFLSKTHFAHNRTFLLILLVTIAIVPVGRHYSFDKLVRRWLRSPEPDATPLWPLWLVRFEVAAVYCASGASKVIDQDWWSGRVLQLRAIDNRELAIDQGAPSWLMDALADGTVQSWLSKASVLTEFVIGLGFLHRRTRLLAIWVAIPFHLTIQIGARVQVFSWAALAALVIWVTPGDHTRELIVPRNHRLARWVPRLDWFGRFRVDPDDGQTVLLMDNRGPDRRGSDGIWTTLSRLPATFIVAGPVLAIRRRRWSSAPDS
jgi:hypothetical protein